MIAHRRAISMPGFTGFYSTVVDIEIGGELFIRKIEILHAITSQDLLFPYATGDVFLPNNCLAVYRLTLKGDHSLVLYRIISFLVRVDKAFPVTTGYQVEVSVKLLKINAEWWRRCPKRKRNLRGFVAS